MARDEADESTALDRREDSRDLEEMERTAKYKYGGIMLLAFLVAVIFRWLSDTTNFLKFIPTLDDKCDGDGTCLGNCAVYRISFSLFLFFVCHLLAASPAGCCFDDNQKRSFYVSWFMPKLVVFGVLCVVSFLLPAGLFEAYAYLCVGLAILFLIMQAIIIIAFAYDWNDSWTGKSGWNSEFDGEVEPRFARGIVCMTGLLFAFGITWVGLMYHWFTPSSCSSSDKNLHLFLITFTLICGVLYTLASAKLDGASILCSGVVFAYTAWTCFSGIMSGSDSDCNSMHTNSAKMSVTSLMQIVVAAATLTYTSLNTGGSQSAFSMRESDGGDSREQKFSYVFFFLAMTVGAGYMSMVLTSWTIQKGVEHGSTNPLSVDNSKTSMWAKIGSEWFTILLYGQTLWAPYVCGQGRCCCGDRDFTV